MTHTPTPKAKSTAYFQMPFFGEDAEERARQYRIDEAEQYSVPLYVFPIRGGWAVSTYSKLLALAEKGETQ